MASAPAEFIPSDHVARFTLDNNTVLFHRITRQIYVLNETAAFFWHSLSLGLTCEEIAQSVASELEIDYSSVLSDCRSLIAQWIDAELGTTAPAYAPLTDTGAATATAEPSASDGSDESEDEEEGCPPDLDADELEQARAETCEHRQYRISELLLNLDAPPRAFELLHGLLDHCAVPAGPLTAECAEMTIIRRDGHWLLFLEGEPLAACDDDARLAPIIHAMALHLSYAASGSRLSIHGAAIFEGDRAVLLPGVPGAGKSTLTAALVSRGLGYCTDDFSMLYGSPLRLRGIPLCIGLKTGSWPLLARQIPELESLPIQLREDGQSVRYLPPPLDRLANRDAEFRVAAIVFPRVTPGEPCRLRPLTRSEGLKRITESGYHLIGEIDESTVEALLEWFESLECFELTYSDLNEAVTTVSGLLR